MGTPSDESNRDASNAARQGTEAEQKGGTEPAKESAKRDFEDSPKEEGE